MSKRPDEQRIREIIREELQAALPEFANQPRCGCGRLKFHNGAIHQCYTYSPDGFLTPK